jgi:PTS system nitrogen regulatory IIA component
MGGDARPSCVPGGIYTDLHGATREEVLESVSRLPGVPAGVDRAMLAQLLIGREALASTGVGEGVAIPHPRDPLIVHVDEPHVMLCFLAEPVDFGAIDGLPVRVLFTVLAPSVRLHLQTVSRLAFALHDPVWRGLLSRVSPAREIIDRVRALEDAAGAATTHAPAPPRGQAG